MSVVDSSSPRGGRFAPRTFSGRFGGPGIFNAWLPSLTPTGVGAGSRSETMTYNVGSRLVTSIEGAVVSVYTFDTIGNQTAVNAGGSQTIYAYDHENRMRRAIDPGGARSTLAYWAHGMRRFLEFGGTRTTFVSDGSDYLQSRTPSEVTTISTVDAQILDSVTGGVIIMYPVNASSFSNRGGGGDRMWSGRLTFLPEISHACGVEHRQYGSTGDCQCNDIYGYCISQVMHGSSDRYCVAVMKKYRKRKIPCA